jgi:putative FmdB family regulatory protein
MPTYDYRCKKCGYTFEKLQPISAKPVRCCPKCKGPVQRMIGNGAGIIFKGSGFYETDYKRKDTSSSVKKTSGKHTSAPLKEEAKKQAS